MIVAVDGSTDGTSEMLAGYAAPFRLRAVAGPQRGRAAACNAALAVARGEVLVLLDDDMRVVPELIERHRRHHPPGSRLCVLGPVPVDRMDDSSRPAAYVQAKFEAHLARLAEPGHSFVPRDFYSGNRSLRTEMLRELDGFDESFSAYGNEDVELALRLRAAGVTLRYDPEAVAHQEYGKDLRGLPTPWRKAVRPYCWRGCTPTPSAPFGSPRRMTALVPGSPDAQFCSGSRVAGLSRGRDLRSGFTLERCGFWRLPLFYRAALDYAFWAGVDGELRGAGDGGDLAHLAAQLDRGPVRPSAPRAVGRGELGRLAGSPGGLSLSRSVCVLRAPWSRRGESGVDRCAESFGGAQLLREPSHACSGRSRHP